MSQSGNGKSPSDASRPKLGGNYTGERMHPALRRQLLTYISQGKSDNQIAKLCKVSRDTLRAFREREAAAVSQRRENLKMAYLRLAEAGTEKMEEEMANGNVKGSLLIPFTGMATDKLIALENAPQQINLTHTLEPGPNLYAQMRDLAERITRSYQGSAVLAPQSPSDPPETQTNTTIDARLNSQAEALHSPAAVRALPSPQEGL